MLCEWFDKAPDSLEVEEELIGLGRYGRVLTLLWARDLLDPDMLEETQQGAGSRERDWRDALRGYEMG